MYMDGGRVQSRGKWRKSKKERRESKKGEASSQEEDAWRRSRMGGEKMGEQ